MTGDVSENPLDEGVADLHMHTTASDGTLTVAERVALAEERSLSAIAITDHDTLSADLSEPVTTNGSVDVIAGVEVRADLFDTKIEILGYFLDPADEQLQELLARAREFRTRRNTELVERLARVADLDITYESLVDSVEGALGRPHLAEVLVEHGRVDSIQEAFDEYLARDGEVYVPMERLDASVVIETLHAAGGVTSLAHPGRIRADTAQVEQMVERLVELGIDGLEVWYPYGAVTAVDDLPITPDRALELAHCYDLIPTGGSDCHGPGSEKFRLGEVRVPGETVDALKIRHAELAAERAEKP